MKMHMIPPLLYPPHHDLRWIADHVDQIVPMSKEDMKMRGLRNARHKDIRPVSLWFIDASGNKIGLTSSNLNSETSRLRLDFIWPEYIKKDLKIREINEMRKDEYRQERIKYSLDNVNYENLLREINYHPY
jgi:hypothetical protein